MLWVLKGLRLLVKPNQLLSHSPAATSTVALKNPKPPFLLLVTASRRNSLRHLRSGHMAFMRNGRNALRQIITNVRSKSESEQMMNSLVFACQGVRHRKLEVILTTNVDKLGKAGETVKVAPGYFRNHLMPKLLAVPNIDKYAYLIRQQRKNAPLEEEEVKEEVKVVTVSEEVKMKEYEKAAKRVDNARLVLRRNIDLAKFRTRATKEDPIELRSAVTKEDIVAEVARQLSIGLEPDNVHLPSPLSTVGEYEVPLRLPRSIPLPAGKVHWTLNVKIRCA